MTYIRLFSAALLLALFSRAEAQRIDTFSNELSTFEKELEEFITSNSSSQMEDAWNAFEQEIIKSGALDAEQWSQVIHTSNRQRRHRMTASYFVPYLYTLLAITKKEDAAAQFANWHAVYNQLLDDADELRLKKIREFLTFSQYFHESGSLRYNKLSTSWMANADQYSFIYENLQLHITFEKTDLIALRLADSIRIEQTSGTYDVFEQTWEGSGGTVNWQRYLRPDINVTLGDYQIDMTKPGYQASMAILSHPVYFPNSKIEGSFEDRIFSLQDSALTGRYPQFTSFDSSLQVENIGKNVRYRGGFGLNGTTVRGFGLANVPAQLEVFDNAGNRVYKGLSDLFSIRKGERIGSKSVASSIYYSADSITHGDLLLRYDIPDRTFNFSTSQESGGGKPFFDSRQQANIYAENMQWQVGTDSITIGKRTVGFSAKGDEVIFESLNYFDPGEYRRMQSIGSYNPIATFRRVAREQGTDVLSADLLASELDSRLNVERIKGMLYDMAERGFISYDAPAERVTILPKLYHYANAAIKKSDYDYLRISSQVKRSANARLNLQDNTIVVNGVDNLEFSPVQKVAVKPLGQQIVFTGNRNLDMAGKVFAGYSLFDGKDFHFMYDPFHIQMDSVRFLDLYIPSGEQDRDGNPIAISLASRIEHASGVLLIDAPANKSGEKDIPLFPAFNSQGPAYVYYDAPDILGGVYERDSFYFSLDPFSLNSLDQLEREELIFDGTLFSADIFQPFTERLEVQEDESLGFQSETPTDGRAMYLGKGTYVGSMTLRNDGFRGEGSLRYLGTTIEAQDFIYRPKQLTCSANEFLLEEDRNTPEFPYAYGIDVNVDWRPYADSMYIFSKEAPFEMYTAPDYYLQGTLVLTPDDLHAQGELDWPTATLKSKDMTMGAYSALSDTASIRIKALEEEGKIALSNSNVKANIDFDEQYGSFESNSGQVATLLPYNFYETSMNAFDWDMKQQRIVFKNAEGVLSNFVSTHPDKDSLKFQGTEASYDLLSSELQIGGIPYIISCDALIYPDSGTALVRKGGQMDSLTHARIVASLDNRQHEITKATVQIEGAKNFRASGYYQYNVDPWEQEILFDNIVGSRYGKGKKSEKPTETRATGSVTEEDQFHIDNKTLFAGTISLNSNSSALHFDGVAQLDVPELPQREWFTLNSDGDKRDLIIELNDPKNQNGQPIRAGFFLSKETAEVYPRVMQSLFFRKDRPIFDATGFMDYDDVENIFRFGDSSKVLAFGNKGALLQYIVPSGKIVAEGKFNIGSGLDYVSVDAAGLMLTSFRADADSFRIADMGMPTIETTAGDSISIADSTLSDNVEIVEEVPSVDPFQMMNLPKIAERVDAKMIAGITIPLPDNLISIILSDLNASVFGAESVKHVPLPFYEKALSELILNDKTLAQVMRDLRTADDLNIPRKENPYTFLFSKLDMAWNQEYQSWISQKNTIGLATLNGVPINKQVKAYIEFKMPTNEDDRLYIHIESPGGYFYFFGYKQGIMNVTSNNTAFNDAVLNLKKKELIQKMDDGGFYEIQWVEKSSARAFVNRVLSGRLK